MTNGYRSMDKPNQLMDFYIVCQLKIHWGRMPAVSGTPLIRHKKKGRFN